MSDHRGRRRRQSRVPLGRLLILGATLVVIGRLLTLAEPNHAPPATAGPLTAVPLLGPVAATQSGLLGDGTAYQPRIFVSPQVSIGVAPTRDGGYQRLLRRTAEGALTELRRLRSADHPQFDGFTASGDTLVWAETLSRTDSAVRTTLWAAKWRTAGKPVAVTSDTGDATFYGSQYDLVVNAGRVYWTAVAPVRTAGTDVRSVALTGGSVSTQRFTGEYALSAWPWLVSMGSGRGIPVRLVNLKTRGTISVPTSAAEVAACSPQWCRMGVLVSNALVRIDLQRPNGSQRRRVAGAEATPTLVDVALLDRFEPLTTDRGEVVVDASPPARGSGATGPVPSAAAGDGVDLSLYDLTTGLTRLLATDVANVQARAGMLWWSTGIDERLAWYAVDLRTFT